MLVENRSGGTGSVGMTYARESAADGYTICYIPVELVMQKALEISDLVPDDFTFIGRLTEVPAALTVKRGMLDLQSKPATAGEEAVMQASAGINGIFLLFHFS